MLFIGAVIVVTGVMIGLRWKTVMWVDEIAVVIAGLALGACVPLLWGIVIGGAAGVFTVVGPQARNRRGGRGRSGC